MLVLISIYIYSCVEEFNLNIGDFESRLVVEGVVTNKPGPYYIRLTKSNTGAFIKPDNSYTDNAEPVMNALIIISDNVDQVDTLIPIDVNIEEYQYGLDSLYVYYKFTYDSFGNIIDTIILPDRSEFRHDRGYYKTTHLAGIPERTYYLTIIAEDYEYHAAAYMPSIPQIDSIGYYKNILEKDGSEYYIPLLYFKEPQGVDNYYLIQLIDEESSRAVSAKFTWEFSILSDEYLKPYVNGLNVDDGVSPEGYDFYTYFYGNEIHITMSSLTQEAYNYYKNLLDQFENDGGAYKPTPASPPTNISNGGLGFFRASAVVEKKIIIE